MSNWTSHSRRSFIQAVAGVGIVGTSGCLRMTGGSGQTTGSEPPAETPAAEIDEQVTETTSRQYDVELVRTWESDRPTGGVMAADGAFLLELNGIARYDTDGTRRFETGRFPENFYTRLVKGYGKAVHLDETGLYVGVDYDDDAAEDHGARMYAYAPTTGEKLWQNEEPADGNHSEIEAIDRVGDNLVYASQASGSGDEQRPVVRALDVETGAQQWSLEYDTDFVNQVIGYDDRLYVQQLWVLRAYDRQTRDLLDEKRVGGGFEPTLLDGGDLFVPGEAVHRFDAETFDEVWATEAEYELNTKPAADENAVYVGTESGYVLAFDRENGTQRWGSRVEGAISHPPVLADGMVWIGDERGGLSALDASSGERVYATDVEPDFSFDVQNGVLKDSVREAAFEIRS